MQTRAIERGIGRDSDTQDRRRGETTPIVILMADLITAVNRQFVNGAVAQAEALGMSSIVMPVASLNLDVRLQLLTEIAQGSEWQGVVLFSRTRDADWVAEFEAAAPRMPIVTAGVALRGARRIVPDVEDGMRQAIHHLVDVHHRRRLAFVYGDAGGALPVLDSIVSVGEGEDPYDEAAGLDVWVRVYREALDDHELDADPAWVVNAGADGTDVVEAVGALLKQSPTIDGLIVSNPDLAGEVSHVIRAHGLDVPRDVSMVVLESEDVAVSGSGARRRQMSPHYTAIAPPYFSLGAHAVTALTRTLESQQQYGLLHEADGPSQRADGAHTGGASAAPDLGGLPLRDNAVYPLRDRCLNEVDELMPAELVLGNSCGCSVAANNTAAVNNTAGANASVLQRGGGAVLASDRVVQDFTQSLMAEISVRGLADVFSDHFPKLGIRRALVVQASAETGAYDQVSREGTETLDAAALGDSISRPVAIYRGRTVLTYAAGEIVPAGGDGTGVASSGAPHLLVDDSDRARLWEVMGEPGASLVLQQLVCGDQFLGLVLLGPWREEASLLYGTISDGIAGLLFREVLLADAERLRRRTEAAISEVDMTRRIVDRVQQAPDAEAILRIALQELSEVLGATGAVARLGSQDALLAEEDTARYLITPSAADEVRDYGDPQSRSGSDRPGAPLQDGPGGEG